MFSEAIKEEKQRIRCEMRKIRRNIPESLVNSWSKQIGDYFCSWSMYQRCESIMFYLAMPDEVQTEQMINDALRRGKEVCVPLLGEKYGEMVAAEIKSLDELVVGKYGLKMPDPAKSKLVLPSSIQMVVIPAVAFDRNGNRLGLGAGYYDRFLIEALNSVLVGMAWECQLANKLPDEEHDIKMQYLMTENGLINCRC
jgi:5-formyltetrahydrofolate cyclo-ligase